MKAEFILGDFLIDTPLRPFDWVFEHTLFCAIDVDRRHDYVEAVLHWLKPGGHYLAVNYLIPDKDGPPFGTSRAELMDWFSTSFRAAGGMGAAFLSQPRRLGIDALVAKTLNFRFWRE